MFGRKFGLGGTFMMEKMSYAIGLDSPLKKWFSLLVTVWANLGFSFSIGPKQKYRIVASRSTSRLMTCLGLFRLLMKGIFGPYVL
jgi:hypothetical protein